MKLVASISAAALLLQLVACAAAPPGTLRLTCYGTEVGRYPVEAKRIPGMVPETPEEVTVTNVAAISASVALSLGLTVLGRGAGLAYVMVWFIPGGQKPHHLYPISIVANNPGRVSGYQKQDGRTILWAVGQGITGVVIADAPAGE